MKTTATRRQAIAIAGLGGISLIAGCGGSDGSSSSPDEQASIVSVNLESAESGDVLTVTLGTTNGVEKISLSTSEGNELATVSVDQSTTIDLYTFDSESPAGSYQVTALDASGTTVDQTEWKSPSNITVEDVTVERVEEDFRQLTIDLRNNGETTVTATDAYVTSGFPMDIETGSNEETVGSISGIGGEKTLPPSETTTIVMQVAAATSAGAQERLLAPDTIECPGTDNEAVRMITLVAEFDSEPTKRLDIGVQLGGEYRSYYPYGCERVNIDSWTEV